MTERPHCTRGSEQRKRERERGDKARANTLICVCSCENARARKHVVHTVSSETALQPHQHAPVQWPCLLPNVLARYCALACSPCAIIVSQILRSGSFWRLQRVSGAPSTRFGGRCDEIWAVSANSVLAPAESVAVSIKSCDQLGLVRPKLWGSSDQLCGVVSATCDATSTKSTWLRLMTEWRAAATEFGGVRPATQASARRVK